MASTPEFIHDTERLDQHFLNPGTADRIVDAADIRAGDRILDIGAGSGVLTAAILQRTSAPVTAIEADRQCRHALDRVSRHHANLTVIIDRIQTVPRTDLAATTVIIANPPFSALDHLTRLIRALPQLRQAILCVSHRWADAATAEVGSSRFGVTSLAVQSRFDATIIGQVAGNAFTPAVRRPAALLELTPRATKSPVGDLFADALLNRAGMRLKDLLRSRRSGQALGRERQHRLLHHPTIRRLQQRRLHDLGHADISLIVNLLAERPA